MTTKEVSTKYKVSMTAVYHWIERGLPHTITYVGTTKNYVFDEEEVQRWIDKERN